MATNRTSETEINKHKDVECKMVEEQQVESQQYRESNNVSKAREEKPVPTTITIVKTTTARAMMTTKNARTLIV